MFCLLFYYNFIHFPISLIWQIKSQQNFDYALKVISFKNIHTYFIINSLKLIHMFKKILRLDYLVLGIACILGLVLVYYLFLKNDNSQQELSYGTPIAIAGSSYYYLPLSRQDNKSTKKDIFSDLSYGVDGYYHQHLVNIIFLDSNYQYIKTLLDKKADIYIYSEPNLSKEKIHYLQKHIIYKIAYEDTDKNELLNKKDDHDVYISDLNGANLRQVTENITVSDVEIVDNASKLLITYRKKNENPKEHQYKQFMIYDIAKQKLSLLTALDTAILEAEKYQ